MAWWRYAGDVAKGFGEINVSYRCLDGLWGEVGASCGLPNHWQTHEGINMIGALKHQAEITL